MKTTVRSHLTHKRIPAGGFVSLQVPGLTKAGKPRYKMHNGPGYHVISTVGEHRKEVFTPLNRWGEYAHARFCEDHVIRVCEAASRRGKRKKEDSDASSVQTST